MAGWYSMVNHLKEMNMAQLESGLPLRVNIAGSICTSQVSKPVAFKDATSLLYC